MNLSHGVLICLIIGTLTGWIGGKIMGTDTRQGGFANVFIGIAGALVGGYLAHVLLADSASHNGLLMSFLVALAGACLVILAWTTVSRQRA